MLASENQACLSFYNECSQGSSTRSVVKACASECRGKCSRLKVDNTACSHPLRCKLHLHYARLIATSITFSEVAHVRHNSSKLDFALTNSQHCRTELSSLCSLEIIHQELCVNIYIITLFNSMTNILFHIISLIFLACCGIMTLLGKLFGWTYNEACVYINLYLQYAVLILSALSVVYVAVKKLRLGITKRRKAVLILTILYNVPFVILGFFLFSRYGNMDCDTAFSRCKDDLFALGTYLDIPTNMPYYKKSWTGYYIVNLIIFVALYLLALFANWWIKRIIKKHA